MRDPVPIIPARADDVRATAQGLAGNNGGQGSAVSDWPTRPRKALRAKNRLGDSKLLFFSSVNAIRTLRGRTRENNANARQVVASFCRNRISGGGVPAVDAETSISRGWFLVESLSHDIVVSGINDVRSDKAGRITRLCTASVLWILQVVSLLN